MAGTLDALNGLASGFTLSNVTPGGSPPTQFQVQLVPPGGLGREGGLSIEVEETVAQLTDADITATWVAKAVRFADFDPPAISGGSVDGGTVIGGAPIADPKVLALPTTFTSLVDPFTEGDATKPGVPGVLGGLTGTFQVPMEVTQSVALTVAVDVQWHIRDEHGNPIVDAQWHVGSSSGSGDPPILSGTDALSALTLTLTAGFVDLTVPPAPDVQRTVSASIRLTAGTTSTDWIGVPPLTLTVPAIGVPAVLLLFQDSLERNNMLIVLPSDSPVEDPVKENLKNALDTLNNTLGTLGTAVGVAAFFVSNLSAIKDAIDQAPHTAFQKTDRIDNLNDIDLESGFWNDTEAEDELSSLIFVGPPRRMAKCFNARDRSDSEGEMDVTVGGELLVLVDNLHSNNPASRPAGRVSVPKAPTGSRDLWTHDITTFGDELSSLELTWS